MPLATPDADDTAKTILTLNLLKRDVEPHQVISFFKAQNGHFCTYPGERDASFSANCNVLQALLHNKHREEYAHTIIVNASYPCGSWWEGNIRDKWVGFKTLLVVAAMLIIQNISLQYSMMISAQALVRLLTLWAAETVVPIPDDLLKVKIPLTLLQILNRTLSDQNADGSWGDQSQLEVTAYAVMTLEELSPLPWISFMTEDVKAAIEIGQRFLYGSRDWWTAPQYLWIEKVTYGNPTLSKAYCLAALKDNTKSESGKIQSQAIVEISLDVVDKSTRIFSMLHSFATTPYWKITLSGLEGQLLLPPLLSTVAHILPQQKNAKNKYLSTVPLTWIQVNNANNLFLPTIILWDMMVLLMCNSALTST